MPSNSLKLPKRDRLANLPPCPLASLAIGGNGSRDAELGRQQEAAGWFVELGGLNEWMQHSTDVPRFLGRCPVPLRALL
jgi:hypothetical protein